MCKNVCECATYVPEFFQNQFRRFQQDHYLKLNYIRPLSIIGKDWAWIGVNLQ